MSEQQNTQQPVAWRHTLNNTDGIPSNEPWVVLTDTQDNPFGVPGKDYSETFPWVAEPLYTAPLVPRDVLMAYGREVLAACSNECQRSFGLMETFEAINLAAIADRYASQMQPEPLIFSSNVVLVQRGDSVVAEERIQPEQPDPLDAIGEVMELRAWRAALRGLCVGRELLTPDECAENVRHQLRTAKKAAPTQPEPVNQQMLAKLKRYDIEVEGKQIYRVGSPDGRYVLFDDVAAIAAAEAAQSDHIVDADKMVHAVPDELNCDDIERLRIALSWEGYSTPEGLEQCAARWPELVRYLIRAVLSRKKRAQQPASANPVAVPELRKIRRAEDGRPKANYDEGFDHGWNDCVHEMRAMLSAAQKPEGAE